MRTILVLISIFSSMDNAQDISYTQIEQSEKSAVYQVAKIAPTKHYRKPNPANQRRYRRKISTYFPDKQKNKTCQFNFSYWPAPESTWKKFCDLLGCKS